MLFKCVHACVRACMHACMYVCKKGKILHFLYNVLLFIKGE